MKKALQKGPPPFPLQVVQELQNLEAQIGGRSQLVGLLALAPLTADLRYLLGLLGDPRTADKSLASLCALGNILPSELLGYLKEAAMLRGQVLAAQHVGNGLAAVAEDVMRRAAPYEDACVSCQGTGTVVPEPTKDIPNPGPESCDTCRGTGRLRFQPDLERQKLAIDLGQLLPKGGGISITNQNINAAAGGGLGALEQLQALSDQVLYGGRPPAVALDGETVDVDSPAAEG